MEAILMQIVGEQNEIIKDCDLSDPQNELLNLAVRFKTVIGDGE